MKLGQYILKGSLKTHPRTIFIIIEKNASKLPLIFVVQVNNCTYILDRVYLTRIIRYYGTWTTVWGCTYIATEGYGTYTRADWNCCLQMVIDKDGTYIISY